VNNEPVAWTDKRQLSRPYPHSDAMTMWANAYPEQGIDIPLYTHPVKELTDEEILEAWQEAKHTALNTKGNFVEVLFARAILRKAQEK
jgi:hypothetical protein